MLGEDWAGKFADLSEEARGNCAAEMAYHGTGPGLDFAAEVASIDPSLNVRVTALRALNFRYAHRRIKAILDVAPKELWRALAERGDLDSLTDERHRDRLVAEKLKILKNTPSGSKRNALLLDLDRMGCEDTRHLIFAELEADDLVVDGSSNTHLLVKRAWELDSEATTERLVNRLLAGKAMGWYLDEFLVDAKPKDRAKIARRLLAGDDRPSHDEELAASLLGPDEARVLLERLLQKSDEIESASRRVSEDLRQSYWRIVGLLEHTQLPALVRAIIDLPCVQDAHHVSALVETLNRHGGSRGREDEQLLVPPDLIGGIRRVIASWIDVVRQKSDLSGFRMMELASLIGRIGCPDDIPVLKDLLDFELARWKETNARFLKWHESGRRGPEPSEACMSYFNMYQRAFAAMPSEEVGDIMLAYLDEPEFAVDAARVLYQLARRGDRRRGSEGWRAGGPDFSTVREQRAERERQGKRSNPHPYVAAILDRVGMLRQADTDQKAETRAQELAAIAAGMNYGDQAETILDTLSIGGASQAKYAGLLRLVLAGEQVPGSLVVTAFDEVYEKWRERPWAPNDDWYQVEEWMELLVLSDTPDIARERIQTFPTEFQRTSRLRRTLTVLGQSPDPGAVETLRALAAGNPEFYGDFYWVRAVTEQGTEEAAELFLEVLWDPSKCGDQGDYVVQINFAGAIAQMMERYPFVRARVFDSLSSEHPDPVRHALAHVVQYVDDDEVLLEALNLMSDNSSTPVPRPLSEAIEHRVEQRKPIRGFASARTIVPAAATTIRRRLFEMIHNDPKRQGTAKRVLNFIDRLRDEFGWPEDEPRHPDIASGLPWPPEAGSLT